MERSVMSAVALVGLLTLSGCALAEEPAGNAPEAEQSAPTPSAEEPGAAEDSDIESPPVEVLVACSDGQRIGAQDTITNQTTALRDGDFERAYSYASPSFQDSVSLEQFAGLILASYQPLLTGAVIEFGDCTVTDDGENLSIDVVLRASGDTSLGLRYIMAYTSQGWRVDGASDFRVAGQST